jgi:uncharacterized protein
MIYITKYLQEFVRLSNEMSPYLLLGLLLAGVLHVYFEKKHTIKYLGKPNLKSALYAALIGVPLPLCSCGVIPTGVAFYKEGASKGATVSFLISTPQTGVDSIAVTWSMMSLPFALLRPIIAFITGVFGGFLTNKFDTQKYDQTAGNPVDTCSGDCTTTKKDSKIVFMFRYAFVEFLEDIAKWLVIGLLIATLISVVLPDDFFTHYLDNPFLSMLLVLLVSVPLYICATGSVPVAVALMSKGLSPGAALVLLMAGPATNAATIAVLGKVLGRKTLMIYLFSITFGAIFFGLIIDYLLPISWFAIAGCHGAHHHSTGLPEWFSYFTSIFLGILLLYSLIKPYFKSKKKTMELILNISDVLVVKVDGMTCNHCKANVEKGISTIKGVEKVEVDLLSNTATITGKDISIDDVKIVVESRGYTWGGKA